jgi:hypothetical protein
MKSTIPKEYFSSIKFETDETLDKFLSTLSTEQAIFILSEAVKFSYKQGIFSIYETELISKSLRKIYEVNESED